MDRNTNSVGQDLLSSARNYHTVAKQLVINQEEMAMAKASLDYTKEAEKIFHAF